MMCQLILVLLSLITFVIYNTVAVKHFGIPKSLSETFYLWNNNSMLNEENISQTAWVDYFSSNRITIC